MPGKSKCVFCQIVAGKSPATFLHDDDLVVAFLDINPVTPGHLLVVTREHAPSLSDVSLDAASGMFQIARDLAAALRKSSLRCDGVNLFYADGEVAFQDVFHSHLHVIPRFVGDGFTIQADRGNRPTRKDLDLIGEKIRSALDKS
jgi:histidine triad (HIT) family protein